MLCSAVFSGAGYRHVGCGKSVSNMMLSSPTDAISAGRFVRSNHVVA
jgi:hypothetical protein